MNLMLEDGRIVLFTNLQKKDKQPDFKGEACIHGKTLSISLWKNVSKNGKEYLSGFISDKFSRPSEKAADEILSQLPGAKIVDANANQFDDPMPF